MRGFIQLAAMAASGLIFGHASAQVRFHVRLLELPVGPPNLGYAIGMNARGEVVGQFSANGATHGFYWRTDTDVVDIGVVPGLPGARLFPSDVNNASQVCGWGNGSPNGNFAFRWNRTTPMNPPEQLPELPGGISYAVASAINSWGAIAGVSFGVFGYEAVRWSGDGTIYPLGGFVSRDGFLSIAHGINDDSAIVGVSNSMRGFEGAVWDSSGAISALPEFGGGAYPATLADINNRGEIVGTLTPSQKGFVWDAVVGYRLLDDNSTQPPLYSSPFAITESGVVVGQALWDPNTIEPFLWSADDGFVRINQLLDPCTPPEFASGFYPNAVGEYGVVAGGFEAEFRAAILVPTILADTELDGDTDLADLSALLTHYGSVGKVSFAQGDVDEDGDIDLVDLAYLLARFGSGCTQ